MRDRLQWAKAVRANGGVTVPTTLEEEWRTNVFLRCADPAFYTQHGAASPLECFSKIRKLKDGTMRITTEMLKGMDGMIPGKYRERDERPLRRKQ